MDFLYSLVGRPGDEDLGFGAAGVAECPHGRGYRLKFLSRADREPRGAPAADVAAEGPRFKDFPFAVVIAGDRPRTDGLGDMVPVDGRSHVLDITLKHREDDGGAARPLLLPPREGE